MKKNLCIILLCFLVIMLTGCTPDNVKNMVSGQQANISLNTIEIDISDSKIKNRKNYNYYKISIVIRTHGYKELSYFNGYVFINYYFTYYMNGSSFVYKRNVPIKIDPIGEGNYTNYIILHDVEFRDTKRDSIHFDIEKFDGFVTKK